MKSSEEWKMVEEAGHRLAAARAEKRYSQAQLATILGTEQTMLSKYERGKAEVPPRMWRILQMKGFDVEWIKTGKELSRIQCQIEGLSKDEMDKYKLTVELKLLREMYEKCQESSTRAAFELADTIYGMAKDIEETRISMNYAWETPIHFARAIRDAYKERVLNKNTEPDTTEATILKFGKAE